MNLSTLAQKVVKVYGENHPELIVARSVFHSMKDELEQQFHCGSVHNPLCVMESEHDDVAVALTKMRELTGDYQAPDDACTSYRVFFAGLISLEEDLHMHVHEENNMPFPGVRTMEASLS